LEVVWPRGRERDASQHRLQLAEEVSGHGEGAAACLIAASDCYLLTRVVDERRNRLLACNEDQLGRGYGLRGAALRSARQRQREDGMIELSGRSCRRELRAEGNLASVRRQRDSEPVWAQKGGRGKDRLIQLLPEGPRALADRCCAHDGHPTAAVTVGLNGHERGHAFAERQRVVWPALNPAKLLSGDG